MGQHNTEESACSLSLSQGSSFSEAGHTKAYQCLSSSGLLSNFDAENAVRSRILKAQISWGWLIPWLCGNLHAGIGIKKTHYSMQWQELHIHLCLSPRYAFRTLAPARGPPGGTYAVSNIPTGVPADTVNPERPKSGTGSAHRKIARALGPHTIYTYKNLDVFCNICSAKRLHM